MGLLNQSQQAYYSGNNFGGYQFISLEEIINNFMATYVGEEKILPRTKRGDVTFHAMRAIQELSFDTLKSCKAQEITIPASLQMILPQDYVNYTKVSWVDSAGIKHILYPTSKTSNPFSPQQDSDGDFLNHNGELIPSGELIKNGNFNGGSTGWVLNVLDLSSGITTTQTPTTSTVTATLGDPVTGFFYGFDGNAIRAYATLPFSGIRQNNVPIVSGEEYKLTYTLSGYTSGEWHWHIVDKNGDSTASAISTANGTYTEIITASGTASNYTANSMFFRNRQTGVVGNVILDNVSLVRVGDEESSTTWSNYKSTTPSENQDDYQDDTYWPMDGSRFGLDPQHAQANGSFYMDENSGKIHFSSNISGKTVILDYISDGIGTDAEMVVHKFAEEAIYKWIMHGILSTRSNAPEYLVARYKKERFAAIRTAKLRLSNIKLEELTQILRGKSKQIKH